MNGDEKAEQFTAVVTCMHTSKVVTINFGQKNKTVQLMNSAYWQGGITCPPQQAPTGAGYDLQPTVDPQRFAAGPLPFVDATFTTMRPVPGGWRFGILNRGPPVRAKLMVRCTRRQSRSRRLTIARVTRRVPLGASSEASFTRRCPSGWQPLFAGWASASQDVRVQGYLSRSKRARYLVENLSREPLSVTLDVLCARAR